MFKIESLPAKICLGFSALMFLLYSISFMFFGDCYVTGGEVCFAPLDNGITDSTDPAYGAGGPETAFNGVLFFGIFISTMLILFEGAKGKWIIMIPSSLGLISMTFGVWMWWNVDSMAGPLPKYMSIIVTLIYIGGYLSLRNEGVNDGLSDFKPGLKVKDKIAMVSLIVLVLAGLFYSIRMILTPNDVIAEGFPANYEGSLVLADGLGKPLPTQVSVTGSLILVYTLWSALVLMDGASGKWPIIHPSAFAFITATVSTYIALIANTARNASEANQMDALTGGAVMLLILISYFRLKDEGMEDDMTFMGEPQEDKGAFANALLLFALVMGALFTINHVLFG
ncbi:MAG: hypothetical protein CMB13_06990 [Euryarchaeota archaeon]|nr:hypothetical protein [Euryarchaeota archaeon]